jgi:hypothetical protein
MLIAALVVLAMMATIYPTSRIATLKKGNAEAVPVFLVINVGSAPDHQEFRALHRLNYDNYMKTPASERVVMVFSTERTEETEAEQLLYGDIVFNPGDGGYTDFAARGLYNLGWAIQNYRFDYYLRLDDDGVLCFDRLVYQLKAAHSAPQTSMLFWGKYWCRKGVARADENFMLFSRALAVYMHTVLSHVKTGEPTFALNVGVHLIQMEDVVIFDDREQIDSQQGYVTSYMRLPFDSKYNDTYHQFCSQGGYLWAHHVKSTEVMRAVIDGQPKGNIASYPEHVFRHPSETCGGSYTFDLHAAYQRAGVPQP